MFPDTPMWQILAVGLLLSSPFMFISKFPGSTASDPVKREWDRFRMRMLGPCVMLLVLWFALPSTPVLATFGYPSSVERLTPYGNSTTVDPRQLLRYLQDYNRALVRTTEVVHWLIFISIWWFGLALFRLSKVLGSAPPVS